MKKKVLYIISLVLLLQVSAATAQNVILNAKLDTFAMRIGEQTRARLELSIDSGYNVVVLPGFAFANAIIATADNYPEVKFVALDVSEFDLTGNGWTIPENVYSAVYQEEISGYFAGYAAVKLGYTKLGYCGGMAVPAVLRFGYGFLQGADAAAVCR